MSNEKLSYKEINEKIEKLKQEATEARERGLTELRDIITSSLGEYDMTLAEFIIFLGGASKSGQKGGQKSGSKAATTTGTALYKDPDSDATWTGRGRKPGWMKDKDPDKVRIKDDEAGQAS